MRSRYSAYAARDVRYLLDTTHPNGPQHRDDAAAWAREVAAFCDATAFEGLQVLGSSSDGDVGWVTFRAQLAQGGRDVSFSERSRFERTGGRWLYHSGRSPARP